MRRFLYCLLLLLPLAGCHESRPLPVPTPDPCAQPAAARYYFNIASKNISGDKFFTCDTTFRGNVRFTASPVYTAVQWRIGSDPRTFTNNPQVLDFLQPVGTISIRLIGTRPVDKCRPGDRGVDTLFKTLTVLPYDPVQPRAAIMGVFLGAASNAPLDTFRVSIWPARRPYGGAADLTLIPYNLNQGCPGTDMDATPQYRAIEFSQSRNDAQCHGVYGYAVLDSLDRNKLRIVYHELTPGQQYVSRVFVGYRQK